MTRLPFGALLSLIPLAVAPSVLGDDGPRLRPSVAFGGAGLFPSRDGQRRADPKGALDIDASLELGPVFLAGTLLQGLGETTVPDHSFLGVKLGYVFGDGPFAPYLSAGIGHLSQTALFNFDEGTTGSASGLGFELEAGAVLFRRAELFRIWIYALVLLPTFEVRSPFGPEAAHINALGFGLRLGL